MEEINPDLGLKRNVAGDGRWESFQARETA